MLIKLLKYEIKATSRILLPLYGALIVFAGIINMFSTLKFNIEPIKLLGRIPFILSIFCYGATMTATFIVTVFIIIQRFYKNLLGNEGYLMNTLPVSTDAHIICKLITAIFWSCISILVAILSILIVSATDTWYLSLFSIFKELYSQFGSKIFLSIIDFILASLSQLALIITLIYTSISIGNLLPKMKLLGAFAAFIALNTIMKLILYIPIMFIAITNYTNPLIEHIKNLSNNDPVKFFNLLFLCGFIINIIWLIIYFMITKYILKNKLNLE